MATQETRWQKISFSSRAVVALLGFAGLIGLSQATCPLGDILAALTRVFVSALLSVIPALWNAFQPCVSSPSNLLNGVLPIYASCWQLVLAFTGVA